jgi:glutaredoxin 3
VESLIQSEIDANEVVVFSKSYCPYCLATKSLFKGLGVPVRVIELDQRPDGGEIQGALLQRTGQRTVPNTFIGGVHLGGNDSAQAAARSGELQKKLGLSSS